MTTSDGCRIDVVKYQNVDTQQAEMAQVEQCKSSNSRVAENAWVDIRVQNNPFLPLFRILHPFCCLFIGPDAHKQCPVVTVKIATWKHEWTCLVRTLQLESGRTNSWFWHRRLGVTTSASLYFMQCDQSVTTLTTVKPNYKEYNDCLQCSSLVSRWKKLVVRSRKKRKEGWSPLKTLQCKLTLVPRWKMLPPSKTMMKARTRTGWLTREAEELREHRP